MGGAPFQKQVSAAKPRLRIGFVVALLVVMAGGLVWLLVRKPETETRVVVKASPQHCSPLDAASRVADPKMSEVDRATCLAIAGKISAARRKLFGMQAEDRAVAIQQIFSIAHPIADSGDDESAGPIMALVVEMWPENYMAVFHAGMAEFALGHDANARAQLERFLEMYQAERIVGVGQVAIDGSRYVWRQRAEKALADIASHAPLDERIAHFPE